MGIAINSKLPAGFAINGKNVGGLAVNGDVVWQKVIPVQYGDFLTFESDTDFYLYVDAPQWEGTMYTSTNATVWEEWVGTTPVYSRNGVLYIRGTGNTVVRSAGTALSSVVTRAPGDPSLDTSTCLPWNFIEASNLRVTGNIETLLDWETVSSGGEPTRGDACYAYMFQNCTALTIPPSMPAYYQTSYCYYRMFSGCTALITAPNLYLSYPINYKYYCYAYMFYGCSNLKISETQSSDYPYAWTLAGLTSLYSKTWTGNMLTGTGGTFTDDPSTGTTYYLENESV